jgi:hypothetical protein
MSQGLVDELSEQIQHIIGFHAIPCAACKASFAEWNAAENESPTI